MPKVQGKVSYSHRLTAASTTPRSRIFKLD